MFRAILTTASPSTPPQEDAINSNHTHFFYTNNFVIKISLLQIDQHRNSLPGNIGVVHLTYVFGFADLYT